MSTKQSKCELNPESVLASPELEVTVDVDGTIKETDLQAVIDKMTKLHDGIFNSVSMFFKGYMMVSVLIFMVPVYVLAHYYVQNEETKVRAYSVMIGAIALMFVGLFVIKYST